MRTLFLHILLAVSSIFFSSCGRTYSDFTPLFDTGERKPSCVLLPIRTSRSLSSLPSVRQASDFLYDEMYREMCAKGRLYMPRRVSLEKQLQSANLSTSALPVWELDPALWEAVHPFEYCIGIEIVQCDAAPYIQPGRPSSTTCASLVVRLAVFRRGQSLILLQTVSDSILCPNARIAIEDPLAGSDDPKSPSSQLLRLMASHLIKIIENSTYHSNSM